MPIQPRPAAGRPSPTLRRAGMPSSRRGAPPRMDAITGSSISDVAMVSSNSFGAAGPRPMTASLSPSASRYRPISGPVNVASNRPGAVSSSSISSVVPSGWVMVTAPTLSSSVRRMMRMVWPVASANRVSSSSSGSFIIQWARRRSNSNWGPPPSYPRDQSHAWSEAISATRPSPTRSSIRSGRSSTPVISTSASSDAAMSIWRNQRPHVSWFSMPAVTGCLSPRSVMVGR